MSPCAALCLAGPSSISSKSFSSRGRLVTFTSPLKKSQTRSQYRPQTWRWPTCPTPFFNQCGSEFDCFPSVGSCSGSGWARRQPTWPPRLFRHCFCSLRTHLRARLQQPAHWYQPDAAAAFRRHGDRSRAHLGGGRPPGFRTKLWAVRENKASVILRQMGVSTL